MIIDIALDNYNDFFNEWDNTSFKIRDIHPELEEYLNYCSEEIPLRKKLEIHFFVEDPEVNETRENQIKTSYLNYYTFMQRIERKKMNRSLFQVITLTAIAIVCIFAYYMIESGNEIESIWGNVLVEGLMIGGWVFAWEALSIVTFEMHKHLRRISELKRFFKAKIHFGYKK